MAGGRLGTIFVELNIDDKVFKQKLSEELKSTQTTAKGMERIWRNLGISTEATYRQEVLAYQNSRALIRASTELTARDRVRAEEVITYKLKALHEEQYADYAKTQAANNRMSRDSQSGWLSMMKGMLAYRAIMFGMQAAWEATVGSVTKGIEKINDFQTAQASMAAAIASTDFKGSFDDAFNIAGGLIQRVELLDRKFVGTGEELRTLTDAMLTYGMGIDLSTQKAENQFVAFANMIKLLTRGQDFQRQAMQEVRSLMEGSNVQGAMLVKKIEAAGYNAKAMVPIWREQGVLLEKINEIMGGYEKAGTAIERTWGAQKGTLETIYSKILREGMEPAYNDILALVIGINDSLLDQNGLTDKGLSVVDSLKMAWQAVKDAVLSVGAAYTIVSAAFKSAGTAIGGGASVVWSFLKGDFRGSMETFDALWPSITSHIDEATLALEGYSRASSGVSSAQSDWSKSMAAEMGYDRPGELKVPGSGRKPATDDKAAKELKKRLEYQQKLWEEYFAGVAADEYAYIDAMYKYNLKTEEDRIKMEDEKLKYSRGKWTDYYKDQADQEIKDILRQHDEWLKVEEEKQKAAEESSKMFRDFAVNAFNDVADTLANFVTTGKLSFRSFIDSALADLTRLMVRMQMFSLLENSGFMGWIGMGASTSANFTKGSGYFSSVPEMRASGGPVSGGTPYMVGEQGPELFVPTGSGTIVPNGGGKTNLTVNIRNESGQKVAAKSASASFDLQGTVIDIVLDGLSRNVHGLRTAMGGA